jgi:hypothetical protein
MVRNALGFRTLMDIVPLEANLVRGSHGRIPDQDKDYPVLLASTTLKDATLSATQVYDVIRDALIS